jgi:hypothetical protein
LQPIVDLNGWMVVAGYVVRMECKACVRVMKPYGIYIYIYIYR